MFGTRMTRWILKTPEKNKITRFNLIIEPRALILAPTHWMNNNFLMKGIRDMKTTTLKFLAISALALAGTPAALATTITDPPGDFLPTFTGTQTGDLDVVGISVILDGSDFVLTATLNGAVNRESNVRYVWGVNRGAGTPGFASIGLNGVLFDAVILLASTGAA